MSVDRLGHSLSPNDQYQKPEIEVWNNICEQVNIQFPNDQNLVINMTWFGPQFDGSDWYEIVTYKERNIVYDNLFFLATVDPPYLNVLELQEVKNMVGALHVYYLGNFGGPHQFNLFAPLLVDNFKKYTEEELILKTPTSVYMTLNRKPKEHRVDLVKALLKRKLDKDGIITLGKDETNDLYITMNTNDSEPDIGDFGMSMVYYNLGCINKWKSNFLYINGATEFNPINDLFCQQDTFKPMLGMRPFVINGVQKTYRWLRYNGFKTFNNYWSHIDIEHGNVKNTVVELIEHLKCVDLNALYNDMLPDLRYNKQRLYEFASEQRNKMNNLFT